MVRIRSLCAVSVLTVFLSSPATTLAESAAGPSVRAVSLERWEHLSGIRVNENGSVALLAGRQGYTSEIRLALGDRLLTVVRAGDPVPDDPTTLFYQFRGISNLNDRDEIAFAALLLPCSDPSKYRECVSKNIFGTGVFLYSNGRLKRIAGSGDPVEGYGTLDKEEYGGVSISSSGDALIQSSKWRSVHQWSLILWHNGSLRKIVSDGDPLPTPFSDLAFQLGPGFPRVLADAGHVVFAASCARGYGLFRFDGSRISKVVMAGDPSPTGPVIDWITYWADVNGRGEAVFDASWEGVLGAIVRSNQNGVLSLVALPGTRLPDGTSITLGLLRPVALGADGEVLLTVSESGGGIYRSTQDRIEKLVGDGDSAAPFSTASYLFDWRINSTIQLIPGGPGSFAFSAAFTTQTAWNALFLQAGATRSMLARIGDPAPGTGGLKFANRYFDLFAMNQLNEVAFRGYLCCGAYREGTFLAGSPRLKFANGDFDDAGDGELPARWSRIDGPSDGGYATRYDSGGADSWTGSSALRLHVSSSGGTVAVQSEPVAVTAGTEYLVTSRMRYQFRSRDQVARLSVVQYDAEGNSVGTQSVEGRAGDNLWTWQPNALRVRMAEKAARVRVRIELKSDRDCYLDVDTVR